MIQTEPDEFDPDNPDIEPGSAMAHLKVYAQQRQPCDPDVRTQNAEGNFRYRGDAAPEAIQALSALLMLCDEREENSLLPGEVRGTILSHIP